MDLLSLGISITDFNFDEIQSLRDQIADLERDLALGQITLGIDEQNMQRALEVTKLSSEIAERSLAGMTTALEQASLDLEREKISELEYRRVAQSRNLAEVTYLNSLIAIYDQIATLLQSYGAREIREDRS